MSWGPKTQVAGTNDCSILSKSSIVAKGYVKDPFLNWFVDKSSVRAPIINRGYYVRHRAVEYGFKRAFSANCINVVVSLGAGFDTSALRNPEAFFIELDYPSVCKRKAAKLLENNRLQELLQEDVLLNEHDQSGLILLSSRYLLIAVDLRKSTEVKQLFENEVMQVLFSKMLHGFNDKSSDFNFVLFNECSLCYIEQEYADKLLHDIMDSVSISFSTIKNSIRLSFTYLGYEMLRSQSCNNDFGDFLLGHFSSLGAGILTFIDESNIRQRFLDKMKFDNLEIVNMKRFWREHLSSSGVEWERIRALEPFDELEELDIVCASYSLTIAKKLIYNKGQKDFKEQTKKTNGQYNDNACNLPAMPVKRTTCVYPDIVPVFGHCSHSNSAQNLIQIFGGFGLEPTDSFDLSDQQNIQVPTGGHRRYANIVELNFDDRQPDRLLRVKVIRPESKSTINRLHSQVINLDLNDNTRFFLSGGRSSPAAIQPNAFIEISQESESYRLTTGSDLNRITNNSSLTPSAFRHLCARFGGAESSNKVIQFGGITGSQLIPNGTVFLFDINLATWSSHQIANLNTERHSMAFTPFQSNSILLNGGLDLNDNFSSDFSQFELIDSRECRLNQLSLKNRDRMQALYYSHRLKQISEYEVLSIGGIGVDRIESVATRIDLRALDVVEQYSLKCLKPNMLLLHSFTCEFAFKRLCLVGGGGNCFSFGTHFNPITLYDFE